MPENPAPPENRLRRSLRLSDSVAILVGITIGAGIYSTPQIIAAYGPSFPLVLLLWSVGGLFALAGGLIYAELGTRLPRTGGEYVYIHRAFGPLAGFMFGWSQLLIIRTSAAAGLSIVVANYLQYFLPLSQWQHTAVALGVVFGLGFLNYRGMRPASVFQKTSTMLKVAGILLLVSLALILGGGGSASSESEVTGLGLSHFPTVLMLIVFSYLGWDRVGYVAEEMIEPRRTLPAALVIGLGTVMLLYLAAIWFYYDSLGSGGVAASQIVASDAAEVLLGPVGASLVSLLVIISALGSINGTMMTSTRVYYAMAREGLFFGWLGHLHPRFRTPSRSIATYCGWTAVILPVRQQFSTIVTGVVFAILIFYGLTTLALFRFRARSTGEQDCYRVPFYPYLPALYLIGTTALLFLRLIFEFRESLHDLAFILSGLPLGLWWVWRRRSAAPLAS